MIVLTSDERVVLTQRLQEAEAAYHQLVMGGSVRVVVDQNGERIEYNQGSVRSLFAYITGLKVKLGLGPSGPLEVYMG